MEPSNRRFASSIDSQVAFRHAEDAFDHYPNYALQSPNWGTSAVSPGIQPKGSLGMMPNAGKVKRCPTIATSRT